MRFSDPLTAGGMLRGRSVDLVDQFAPLDTTLSRQARRRGRRAAAVIGSRGRTFRPPQRAVAPHPDGGGPTGLENHSTQSLLDMLFSSQHTAALAAATSGDAYERAQAKKHLDEVQAVIAQLPAQVGADYDKAIAQSAALGNASAQMLGAANPNASVQADLAAIGAPQAQSQQVTSALQNAFQGAGAVMFQQGSVIPGQALESEKASQQAYFRGMGGVAQQQYAYRMSALDQDLVQTKAKLQQDYDSNLITEKQASDAQARADAAAKAQADQWAADYKLKVTAQKQNAAVIQSQIGNRNFGQQATKVRLQQGQQSLALRQLQSDRSWQAELTRLGISQGNLKLRAAQLELNARRKTKAGKQPSADELQQMADLAYYGTPDKVDAAGNKIPGRQAINYQAALFGMLNQGVPLAVAQRYLNQYYAPGEDGRPRVPIQQRKSSRRYGGRR